MKAKLSPFVQRSIVKIYQKDKKLAARIQKQVTLFEANPSHPSLRILKLSGSFDNMWSLSVTMSVRIVYKMLDKNTAYFVDIGSHKEVYRK